MLSEDTKILEFDQCHKSDKILFIIYEDLESLIENIHGCKNNPKKLSTTNVSENIPSGICNLKYGLLKEITIIFLNGSNYNYHFIIKELAEEFER